MSLEAGSQVGHYRVERQLGSGGMGEVYLARDTHLDRLVALKLLVAPTEDGRRRLLREARAVAQLDHPGICAVHEVGHDEVAGDFIAMQYVEGETLLARLRRGRLRPDDALNIAAHVAEALIAAHRHGIIHRDLKPGNIILTTSGAPKILDFGLATHIAGSSSAAEAITASQVTDPNVIVGTPAYMSPEQVRNELPDVRSDVFSLGAVVYECLTGRRPFDGRSNAEIMGSVLHVEPLHVSAVVPDLGPAYDGFCARLLNKQPAERFQSAEEVLGAIRALVPSSRFTVTAVTNVPKPKAGRRHWLTALVAVSAAAAGVWWFWLRNPLPEPTHDARRFYQRGVEAMRDGTYVGARIAFERAIQLFPGYPQAYSRLAEAFAAIDDESKAREALLEVSKAVPNLAKLPRDDRLRFEAAREFTLRHFDQAIAAYTQLTADVGGWLDLGRVQEAANQRPAARVSYEKAVALDPQSPAAHLRLGTLQAQTGQTTEGLTSLDEAIRLYGALDRQEGVAQAHLRKGIALSSLSRYAEAREHFERVLKYASEERYAGQRIQARIQLARLEYFAGNFAGVEEMARLAITEAAQANLGTLVAAGSMDLGNAFLGSKRLPEAEAQYLKAIDLAQSRQAQRLEMRARLQLASLHEQALKPAEALPPALAAIEYFSKSGDNRLAALAQFIAGRAYEALGQAEDARRLTIEGLAFAEKSGDTGLTAIALENLAGQFDALGDFPRALGYWDRLDHIHRTQNAGALAYALVNRAAMLVQLGRPEAAEPLLQEIDGRIAEKQQAYLAVQRSATRIRSIAASIQGRFAVAEQLASTLPDDLIARAVAEHSRAELRRGRLPVHTIAAWPGEAKLSSTRAELGYWAARALIARGEPAMALAVAESALTSGYVDGNAELGWRLGAVASRAARLAKRPEESARIAAQSRKRLEQLEASWAGSSSAYFARPDLAALRKEVR